MSTTVTNYILKIGLLLGTSWLPGGTSWLVPRYMLHDTVTVMVCLVLSWRILGRPFDGVSRQWPVVVRYGMRRATGASLSSWFLKAAGLSCFQSPTVLAANELRSPDEDAPIALNLNRWFVLVLLSAATKKKPIHVPVHVDNLYQDYTCVCSEINLLDWQESSTVSSMVCDHQVAFESNVAEAGHVTKWRTTFVLLRPAHVHTWAKAGRPARLARAHVLCAIWA